MQCLATCTFPLCFNLSTLYIFQDVVIHSPDWVYLDKENLIVIIQRSDLVVESEYVLLQAVVRWLSEDTRLDQLHPNLTAILPYIR